MKNHLLLLSGVITSFLFILTSAFGQTDWSTSGNSISSGDFLGSTNNLGFTIKTNNTDRVSILAGGNVGIGRIDGTH